MKRIETLSSWIGGTLAILGFGGLAGWTETGTGLIFSLVVLVIGIYLCGMSLKMGSIRKRNEYYRIHRISYKR